jgi:transposase
MMANAQQGRQRRRYSDELREQVLRECSEPIASVARIAMAHGINANVVHTWRKRVREALAAPAALDTAQPPSSCR